MRATTLSLLAAVGLACAPHPPEGAPAPGPPGSFTAPTEFPVPEDRVDQAEQLMRELRDALVRRDRAAASRLLSGGDLLASATRDLVNLLSDRTIAFRLEPVCPAGGGVYVRLVLLRGLFPLPEQAPVLYAGPDQDGAWRLFPSGPRDTIPAALVSERAWVRVEPAVGTLRGRAALVLRPGGVRFLPIALDLRKGAPGRPGFDITAVSVPFQPLPEAGVMVAKLDSSGSTTLSLSWQGSPTPGINLVSPGEVVLHEAQPWLPELPESTGEWEVEIDHPADFQLLLEGVALPVRTGGGRITERMHARGDRPPTVFGRPRYATLALDLGEVKVRIAVSPARQGLLTAVAEDIRRAHQALSVLGPLPASDLRIVESQPPPEMAAVGGRSFIALGADAIDRTVLAHELAHSWFGGSIPSTFRGEWGGQWPESLAEYVVLWTVGEREGLRKRTEWDGCYAPWSGEEVPLREARNLGLERALLYCKGPLLMAGLEHRMGRPLAQQALARFVDLRRGRPSSWRDLVEAIGAVAGQRHADWLAARLSRRGAVGFWVDELKRGGGEISGTLVRVDSTPDSDEEVDLSLADSTGQTLGALNPLPVEGERTPFRFREIPGASRVVIDPTHRLVWKHGFGPGLTEWEIQGSGSR